MSGTIGGMITVGIALIAVAGTADAGVIRVPRDRPTIQAAVDAAADGDVIFVAAGRHCGASIDREVHLIAAWGAVVEGCASNPALSGGLRIGLLLVDERASGTSIAGFRFDGAGIGDDDLRPLALAIVGRGAHGVSVVGNRIDGTVQGITNTDGDGWTIAGNVLVGLTVFPCVVRCGGGDGIVLMRRTRDPDDRATGNAVVLNRVSGAVPAGFDVFDMVGVFVLGQDRPVVAANRLAITGAGSATARGLGVQVSDVCCGDAPYATTRGAIVVGNDGRGSEIAVEIAAGNSEGAIVRGNLGVVIVDD